MTTHATCCHCGYDLRGTASPTCPECGGVTNDAEIAAKRRKRRRRHAILALLLTVAPGVGYFVWRAAEVGPNAPLWALRINLVAGSESRQVLALEELVRRSGQGVYGWQGPGLPAKYEEAMRRVGLQLHHDGRLETMDSFLWWIARQRHDGRVPDSQWSGFLLDRIVPWTLVEAYWQPDSDATLTVVLALPIIGGAFQGEAMEKESMIVDAIIRDGEYFQSYPEVAGPIRGKGYMDGQQWKIAMDLEFPSRTPGRELELQVVHRIHMAHMAEDSLFHRGTIADSEWGQLAVSKRFSLVTTIADGPSWGQHEPVVGTDEQGNGPGPTNAP